MEFISNHSTKTIFLYVILISAFSILLMAGKPGRIRLHLPRDWQNTCYQIEFDPAIKGRVWSVWANAHDLPRVKMFSRRVLIVLKAVWQFPMIMDVHGIKAIPEFLRTQFALIFYSILQHRLTPGPFM